MLYMVSADMHRFLEKREVYLQYAFLGLFLFMGKMKHQADEAPSIREMMKDQILDLF